MEGGFGVLDFKIVMPATSCSTRWTFHHLAAWRRFSHTPTQKALSIEEGGVDQAQLILLMAHCLIEGIEYALVMAQVYVPARLHILLTSKEKGPQEVKV